MTVKKRKSVLGTPRVMATANNVGIWKHATYKTTHYDLPFFIVFIQTQGTV